MQPKEVIIKFNILNYPNVVGYSRTLKRRIKNGKQVKGTRVVRIYVSKKVPSQNLNPAQLIPRILSLNEEEVETDIVEIGEVKALAVDKTARIRPVPLGVSVGNWEITAGSLGMLYTAPNGELVAGSNAHVLTDGDASKTPDEIVETRIVQPGAYHGGKTEENVVGHYLWHQRILPIGLSICPYGNAVASFFNYFLKIFGRQGRMRYTATNENLIDFAVYQPNIEHIMKVADDSLTDEPFIGHLFAGSDTVGIICKAKNIAATGYIPQVAIADVGVGDIVKGCSFWCNTEQEVMDEAGVVNVGYGNFTALFADVILVTNTGGDIKGGWSGSGFRLLK